jgi:predicted transcriptional regulator of viral defense system
MSTLKLRQTRRIAGIVTTSELVGAGLSDRKIATLVRRGDLHRVGRGVYADGTKARDMLRFPDGRQLLELAATAAAVGPSFIVSHESAAYLHSIALLARPGLAVSLTGPRQRGWTARTGVSLHAATVPAEQTTSVVGLRVTTPVRTVVDLARTLEFRAGVVAADSALHKKLVTKPELQTVLDTCSRWQGARRAAEVIAFADARAESPLESIARVAFRDCGLPPPELQVWLGGTTEPIGRVDFYWRRYWTIAEVDGALKYAGSDGPQRATLQLRRDMLLREDGYEVIHFTWDQIDGSPERVAASIRAAFQRGERNATRPGVRTA